MKADPAVQLRLLDLQAVDTAAAQLAHRRRTLPELAVLDDIRVRAGELAITLGDLQARIDDVAGEQTRLEKDVELVRSRRSRDESRLAAGGLPGKELEGLQHEVATLDRRQNALEDEVLEIMEQRETLDVEQAQLLERLQRDLEVLERGDLQGGQQDDGVRSLQSRQHVGVQGGGGVDDDVVDRVPERLEHGLHELDGHRRGPAGLGRGQQRAETG